MIFRKLIGLGFLAIILFAFLFLGAFDPIRQFLANDAYTAGYLAGQQAAASEDSTVNSAPPTAAYGHNTQRGWHSGFFPGPLLFLCLLPIIFFGFIPMIFGCKRRHWKHSPGSSRDWHQHSSWKGGGKPVWEDDEFTNDPPKEA